MPTTITPTIVTVNTTVSVAPTPSTLQQSGAIISVGGTTLSANSYQYCGTLSAVTSLLSSSGNYLELTAMATTFFGQGSSVGLYILELGTIAGVDAQIAALGTWITNNPGIFYAYLVPAAWDYSKDEVGSATITAPGSVYTSAPTVTFTAPGSGVTATGTATIQNGEVTAITITNPGSGYTAAPTISFSGGGGTGATATANLASGMDVLASSYASPSGKTYFFVSTSAGNVANYTPNKSVFALVPSSTAPSTEFTTAQPFYQWLSNNPGPANPLAPMGYRFGYGVTPWVQNSTNNANINTILTAYGNLILTGAEGGISTAVLFKGTTMDGVQASFWYGIDWIQIQIKQALAAAIINGSNQNPPLLYNQAGINTLKEIAQNVANSAVSYGCALSAVVSAIDFYTYTTDNPSNYSAGIYNGLSMTVVGQNGFLTITFQLDALEFVA